MTTGQKHLKSGSECPPLKENQLRLYSMRFCPFVRRVKLVLAAKNIPYEEIFINLNDEPECNYLDDLYPEHRLHPVDPYLKAKQQVLIDRHGNVRSAFYKLFGSKEQNAVEDLKQSLTFYEEALQDKFFGGSKPAMVDYMLWPWFERFPALKETGFVLNADGKLPKLANWCKEMQENDAVRKTKVPDDVVQKFTHTVQQGKTDYDVE
ncbi:unnamed protein product [Rotaria sordida]|uniref:Uncharacterized protein n=1 Tax=Rotaria sordida TaxID=392033 RepID=A0A814QII6_9BILA|nr:unnamed protein product [Rotaria sordida]